MSRYYQKFDRAGGFDYELYELPTIATSAFRGPPIDTSAPYLVCIGSAHTFGRFVQTPFPRLLGARLGIPVLNLAVGGSGPRHYLTRNYLELINMAEAVVIQIMSARCASNSLFDNSESGGLIGRILGDQSTVSADDFYPRLAKSCSTSQIKEIVNETRNDYTSNFVQLLRKIDVPKILFWFSTRTPQYEENYETIHDIYGDIFGAFPHLVNQDMVKQFAALCDDYVECISSQGLPQTLWPADQRIERGMVWRDGMLENHAYPSPAMHTAAADALEHSCRRFSGRRSRPR